MGQLIYPVRTPVPVFFVTDEVFLTQIATDAYVPLAQTSITSAYANGAQATNVHSYKHKPRIAGEPAISISRFRDWKPFFAETILCCGVLLFGFDTDRHRCTLIGHRYFYFFICVSSVLIRVHPCFFFQTERLRNIKWSLQKKWLPVARTA